MHVSHQNDALHRDPLSSLRYERSPDTANKLRFVVITGIDRDHPAWYWLRVSATPRIGSMMGETLSLRRVKEVLRDGIDRHQFARQCNRVWWSFGGQAGGHCGGQEVRNTGKDRLTTRTQTVEKTARATIKPSHNPKVGVQILPPQFQASRKIGHFSFGYKVQFSSCNSPIFSAHIQT